MDGIPLDSHKITKKSSNNKHKYGQESLFVMRKSIEANENVSNNPIVHESQFYF